MSLKEAAKKVSVLNPSASEFIPRTKVWQPSPNQRNTKEGNVMCIKSKKISDEDLPMEKILGEGKLSFKDILNCRLVSK